MTAKVAEPVPTRHRGTLEADDVGLSSSNTGVQSVAVTCPSSTTTPRSCLVMSGRSPARSDASTADSEQYSRSRRTTFYIGTDQAEIAESNIFKFDEEELNSFKNEGHRDEELHRRTVPERRTSPGERVEVTERAGRVTDDEVRTALIHRMSEHDLKKHPVRGEIIGSTEPRWSQDGLTCFASMRAVASGSSLPSMLTRRTQGQGRGHEWGGEHGDVEREWEHMRMLVELKERQREQRKAKALRRMSESPKSGGHDDDEFVMTSLVNSSRRKSSPALLRQFIQRQAGLDLRRISDDFHIDCLRPGGSSQPRPSTSLPNVDHTDSPWWQRAANLVTPGSVKQPPPIQPLAPSPLILLPPINNDDDDLLLENFSEDSNSDVDS